MQSKQYFVYILASISKILYIGVANNLQRSPTIPDGGLTSALIFP